MQPTVTQAAKKKLRDKKICGKLVDLADLLSVFTKLLGASFLLLPSPSAILRVLLPRWV